MAMLEKIVGSISNFFWGPPLLVALLGTGLYYTIAFKFTTFTKMGFHMKNTYGTMFKKGGEGKGTVSGFQAACTAIASTIGVGNVAGVATAVVSGGPGAVFWMWVTAWVGCATKAAEIILGQRYRVYFKSIDEYLCGRNYVMKNALHWDFLAKLLAWTVLTSPWSLLVQTNAVAGSLQQAFGTSFIIGEALVFFSLAFTIVGGIRRIAAVADKVVPFMAIFYILGGAYILIANPAGSVATFVLIFTRAFTPSAAVGGFAGATVMQALRFGVARACYSNEAGMGSGMGAHAAAITDHPVRQASWGFGECFIDTIIVCSITALSILNTNVYITEIGITGAPLTTMAFQHMLGPIGGYIVAIAVVLFAWTTLLSAYYGGEKSINFIFGDTKANNIATWVFRAYFLGPIWLANANTGLLWLITDSMTVISVSSSLLTLIVLRKVVVELHNDFWDRYLPALEAGKNPAPVSFAMEP